MLRHFGIKSVQVRGDLVEFFTTIQGVISHAQFEPRVAVHRLQRRRLAQRLRGLLVAPSRCQGETQSVPRTIDTRPESHCIPERTNSLLVILLHMAYVGQVEQQNSVAWIEGECVPELLDRQRIASEAAVKVAEVLIASRFEGSIRRALRS